MNRRALLGLALSSLVTLAAQAADAATPTVVTSFDPAQGQLPEALTTDDEGNLYLSMSNTIVKVTPDGHSSPYATLPTPAGSFSMGLKFGPDGLLYAPSAAFFPGAAYVWRIHPDGQVEQIAELDQSGFPNDMAFDDAGNMYVTDPFLGRIWRIDPAGALDVWIDDPLLAGNATSPVLLIHSFGVDGIAFDKGKDYLYVDNLDYGEILRIPVGAGGEAGDVEIFASDPRLQGSDGIAFDKKGSLYVAVNWQDSIAVVDRDGAVSVVAQGGDLDAPSSLVFGPDGDDKKTLYVTNFGINRALGTQPGAPRPALLSLPVQHGGLPLR